MTLTRQQREAYGPDWPKVRGFILWRSGDRCECRGECGWARHTEGPTDDLDGRCLALNREQSPYTGSKVVLTVAHLDHDGHLGNHQPDRLKAMCQGCHLAYDRAHRNRAPKLCGQGTRCLTTVGCPCGDQLREELKIPTTPEDPIDWERATAEGWGQA